MTEEIRVKVPLIVNTKYRGNFFAAGGEIEILPTEAAALAQRGVIRLDDVPEVKQADDLTDKPLEKMTIPELKECAAKNNIDLGDATKKEDILTKILAASPAGGGNGDQ